jgi:hypothetical protein
MLQRLFRDFGPGHIDEYACGPKSFQLRVSQWFPAPRYDAYYTIWVKDYQMLSCFRTNIPIFSY